MKSFKYKFSSVMKAAIIIGMVLSCTGFGVNLYYLIVNGTRNANDPIYPILQYTLMFLVTVTLFVLLLSTLLCSRYIIDGKTFKTRFGLIVSKYDTEKITEINLNRKTNKLTVHFESGEFIVIVVKQDWYNEFIDALLQVNRNIEYSIDSLDNNDKDTDKKA